MSKASIDDIRRLRETTGAGVMDVKRAIEGAEGDLTKAAEVLRARGLELSAKKADRAVNQGVVEAYVHPGRPLGAIVQLACETDFVARTEEFRKLARDIVMHIAAMAPEKLRAEDEGDGPALLTQAWFRDGSKTVDQVIQDTIARVGENVQVMQFCRYEI